MKRFTTMTAVALIAGTAAFAQQSTAGLNQEVYNQGISTMTSAGYDVTTVRQAGNGDLTFYATDGANERTLVLDASGSVKGDTMGAFDLTEIPEFEDSVDRQALGQYASIDSEVEIEEIPAPGNGNVVVPASNFSNTTGVDVEVGERDDAYISGMDMEVDVEAALNSRSSSDATGMVDYGARSNNLVGSGAPGTALGVNDRIFGHDDS